MAACHPHSSPPPSAWMLCGQPQTSARKDSAASSSSSWLSPDCNTAAGDSLAQAAEVEMDMDWCLGPTSSLDLDDLLQPPTDSQQQQADDDIFAGLDASLVAIFGRELSPPAPQQHPQLQHEVQPSWQHDSTPSLAAHHDGSSSSSSSSSSSTSSCWCATCPPVLATALSDASSSAALASLPASQGREHLLRDLHQKHEQLAAMVAKTQQLQASLAQLAAAAAPEAAMLAHHVLQLHY